MKQKLLESNRTSLDEACEQIIRRLSEEQKPYSITSLAKESQLHRKTVEKAIRLLLTEQEWLVNYRLKLLTVDNRKIITLESRTGMLSYPEDIQRLIIKARHFPLPTPEVYPLVYLYLNDAISPEKSIAVRGKEEEIKRLLRQGKIGEQKRSRYYLTEEGIIVAKGTIQIFPDLEKHKKKPKP
jgi:DNA-binding transcriptional regulator YhcF (GntR family)